MPGHTCLVCDYPSLSEPPHSEFGGGSFEICPSCGFQFGVNDDAEGIPYEKWRKQWEAAGRPWSSFTIPPPADWTGDEGPEGSEDSGPDASTKAQVRESKVQEDERPSAAGARKPARSGFRAAKKATTKARKNAEGKR